MSEHERMRMVDPAVKFVRGWKMEMGAEGLAAEPGTHRGAAPCGPVLGKQMHAEKQPASWIGSLAAWVCVISHS